MVNLIPSSDIVSSYLKWVESTCKPSTVEMYRWHLYQYFLYLKSIKKSLHDSVSDDVILYLNSKNGSWKATIKNQAVVILKGFYGYYINKVPVGMTDEDLRFKMTRENQVREVLSLKPIKTNAVIKEKALTIDNVKKLLIYVKSKNYDHFCFMFIFFYFGFRKSEFRNLKIRKNIFWNENKLIITADISKTRTDRVLYFNDKVKTLLQYIHKKYGKEDWLVDINMTFINKVFMKYDKVVGVHLFPHLGRHTFSTEQLKYIKGKINVDELMAVKMLLGHGGDITQRYTHYKNELKEIMINIHYLNSLNIL